MNSAELYILRKVREFEVMSLKTVPDRKMLVGRDGKRDGGVGSVSVSLKTGGRKRRWEGSAGKSAALGGLATAAEFYAGPRAFYYWNENYHQDLPVGGVGSGGERPDREPEPNIYSSNSGYAGC